MIYFYGHLNNHSKLQGNIIFHVTKMNFILEIEEQNKKSQLRIFKFSDNKKRTSIYFLGILA